MSKFAWCMKQQWRTEGVKDSKVVLLPMVSSEELNMVLGLESLGVSGRNGVNNTMDKFALLMVCRVSEVSRKVERET